MVIEKTELVDERYHELLEAMAQAGIAQAAQGFEAMVGCQLTVSQPQVRLASLEYVSQRLNNPEHRAVGVYLRSQGAMSAQLMLVLTYEKALALVDLMFNEQIGTTQILGRMERSALAELGNLTSSFFLNAVTAITGLGGRPTSPDVLVDMVGAILDVVVVTCGGMGQSVPMLQVTFLEEMHALQVEFWVIPDFMMLKTFLQRKANYGA